MSEYTAEEYQKVCEAFRNMDTRTALDIYGDDSWKHFFSLPIDVAVKKYLDYIYAPDPKVGECWKRRMDNGRMCVISEVKDDFVYFYSCDNGRRNAYAKREFIKYFTITKYKSKYVDYFIKELKEINEKSGDDNECVYHGN